MMLIQKKHISQRSKQNAKRRPLLLSAHDMTYVCMNKNAMQNKKRHFFGSLIYCHCYSLTRQDKDNYIYLGFLLTGSNYRAERKKKCVLKNILHKPNLYVDGSKNKIQYPYMLRIKTRQFKRSGIIHKLIFGEN